MFEQLWLQLKPETSRILCAKAFAALLIWLLLASSLFRPLTFASIRESRVLNGIGEAVQIVLSAIQNVPFVLVAATCSFCRVISLSLLY
jgi:hypothetical protein